MRRADASAYSTIAVPRRQRCSKPIAWPRPVVRARARCVCVCGFSGSPTASVYTSRAIPSSSVCVAKTVDSCVCLIQVFVSRRADCAYHQHIPAHVKIPSPAYCVCRRVCVCAFLYICVCVCVRTCSKAHTSGASVAIYIWKCIQCGSASERATARAFFDNNTTTRVQ